jgi:hypothetical protein
MRNGCKLLPKLKAPKPNADTLADDQVEVPTAFPAQFSRLCELSSSPITDLAVWYEWANRARGGADALVTHKRSEVV